VHYRKDIQILRGLAVLLVVLFHLQIGGIQSGFLGVDIFFVISGFLMAVLYNPNEKGKFFYRRVKRLLPTYYVTVLLTLLFAVFITIPNEYNQVAKQSVYALVFSSNIGFWMQNSYFSKADFNPLLHLWSLGVEMQFYLIVPMLYWIFGRMRIMFPLVLLVSLAACFVIVGISPKTSFFMMPLRLWEFLIGYGIAVYVTDRGNVKYGHMRFYGMMALILLIAIPTFNVDGEALGFMHGHPGLFALLVSLATGGVLAWGLPDAVEHSRVGRALEVLGKYSYSIYLVHFPVIVLFLYHPFSGTVLKADSLYTTLLMGSVIAILSYMMYRMVENPARHSKRVVYYLAGLAGAILLLLIVGKMIQQYRYSPQKKKVFYAWENRAPYRCGKLIRVIDPAAISCDLTPDLEKAEHRIFLVGNSHADAIKSAFVAVSKRRGSKVYFTVSNVPLMQGSELGAEKIVNEASNRGVDAIVLHYSPGAILPETIQKVVQLAEKKHIQTALIMPVPVWKTHIPKAVYAHLESNASLPRQTEDDYWKRNRAFYDAVSKIKGLRIYRVDSVLCRPVCRYQSKEGDLLYFDDGHLTLTGADELHGVFEKVMDDIALPR